MDEDTLEEDGSQDAELLELTEDAVYTTMRFSRPFRSCDPHDLDIRVNCRVGERKSVQPQVAFPSRVMESPPHWSDHASQAAVTVPRTSGGASGYCPNSAPS